MAVVEKEVPFGFLNIYKPKGITSFDVIARLRRIIGVKQIGHGGTLDPFAVGVLPIAVGKAAKLLEYLDNDKEYLATVQFGKNTDTYDLDGEVVETFDKKITEDELVSELKNFEGEILQTPPIYSAIKVNGKKLYEYAREGKSVDVTPRRVRVYKIELKNFDYNTQCAKILVSCSKGTYIRSIAYDVGKKLGCGGYLSALERTKAGKFFVEKSVKLDDLMNAEVFSDKLVPPQDVIDLPTYEMNETERRKVLHGMSIYNKDFKDKDIVFLIYSGKIHAVGQVDKDKILTKKVFEVL